MCGMGRARELEHELLVRVVDARRMRGEQLGRIVTAAKQAFEHVLMIVYI